MQYRAVDEPSERDEKNLYKNEFSSPSKLKNHEQKIKELENSLQSKNEDIKFLQSKINEAPGKTHTVNTLPLNYLNLIHQ